MRTSFIVECSALCSVLLAGSAFLASCGGGGGHGGGWVVFSAPTITFVTPSSGYNDLTTDIQVTGTNFLSGAAMSIGSAAASNVSVVTSASITATVGYGLASGSHTVTVTNTDSQFVTWASSFQVLPPPAEWIRQNLAWGAGERGLTSTCTIIMPDGVTYRMYYTGAGGIWTATSADGVNWGAQVNTGVVDVGATNPAVVRLTSGVYLMIYGIQTAFPTTERLFRATSNDGIAFTKIPGPLAGGAVMIAGAGEDDFVSVPDLIYLDAATLRMYFVASLSASNVHTATSTDNGVNWVREGVISITGGPYGGQVNDPDIVSTGVASYRLYFTTPPAGQAIGDLRIRSATSTNGRSFSLESGSRATPSGSVNVLMDPDAILIPSTTQYRLYYGANLTAGGPDDLRSLSSP